MREDIRELRAALVLLTAAAIWGFAFVAQRAAMAHIGPFTFNGIRFLLGSGSLVPVLFLARRRGRRTIDRPAPSRSAWRSAMVIGVVLFVASSLQQVGLVYTTAGKAGFITGLYVILVPLIGLVLGQRVRWPVWIGATMALGGLYLLTGHETGRIGLGDGLVLASAFGWAAHVQMVGALVRRLEPIRIAVVQTAVCGALSLVVALATEEVSLAALRATVPALAFAGVASVGIAYTFQIVGQRRVDPSRAGLIISLEAVFAVLGGWLLLSEAVTGIMLLGCVLILAGMILSQLRLRMRANGVNT